MKVYFISGLAADSRVFKHIELPDSYEAVHLQWINPLRNESLSSYAMRLAEKIDTSEPFALVGLSMGGMMASEISRQCNPVATILISSIPSSTHLPAYFRLAAAIKLHKMIPISFMKSAAKAKRLFTNETNEDKILLKQIIAESDSAFIRWAMNAVLNWQQTDSPLSYIHIHGTRDEVLPLKYTKPTHTIKNAGHLLVMTNHKEVNRILQETLSSIAV